MEAGAVQLAAVGAACAACHQIMGGPRKGFALSAPAGEEEPAMLSHQAALDELWDGTGIIARAVTSPIVAASPASDSLIVASASSKEGLRHLSSLRVPMLVVRRTGRWDQYS